MELTRETITYATEAEWLAARYKWLNWCYNRTSVSILINLWPTKTHTLKPVRGSIDLSFKNVLGEQNLRKYFGNAYVIAGIQKSLEENLFDLEQPGHAVASLQRFAAKLLQSMGCGIHLNTEYGLELKIDAHAQQIPDLRTMAHAELPCVIGGLIPLKISLKTWGRDRMACLSTDLITTRATTRKTVDGQRH